MFLNCEFGAMRAYVYESNPGRIYTDARTHTNTTFIQINFLLHLSHPFLFYFHLHNLPKSWWQNGEPTHEIQRGRHKHLHIVKERVDVLCFSFPSLILLFFIHLVCLSREKTKFIPNKNTERGEWIKKGRERKRSRRKSKEKCTKPVKTIMHKLNRFISYFFSIFCVELIFFSKSNCFQRKLLFAYLWRRWGGACVCTVQKQTYIECIYVTYISILPAILVGSFFFCALSLYLAEQIVQSFSFKQNE